MIQGVHHVAVSTRDIEALAKFYVDNFGFEVVLESGWEEGNPETDAIVGLKNSAAQMKMIRAGNMFIELFQYSNPIGKPVPENRPAADHGYTHFCLYLTDIDAEYARLSKVMTFHSPPVQRTGRPYRATYGRDPEGNIIELLEVLDHAHPFSLKNVALGS